MQASRVPTETTSSVMLTAQIGWFREKAYFLIDFQSLRIGMDNQILNNMYLFILILLIEAIVDM